MNKEVAVIKKGFLSYLVLVFAEPKFTQIHYFKTKKKAEAFAKMQRDYISQQVK